MKIKEGFVLRSIGDNHIVVGEGLAQINFNKIVSMNSTAAYLWDKLQGKDFSKEDACSLLLEAYDVDEKTAATDASALVDKWIDSGLVEE